MLQREIVGQIDRAARRRQQPWQSFAGAAWSTHAPYLEPGLRIGDLQVRVGQAAQKLRPGRRDAF